MEKKKRFNKTEWSWIMYDWANSVWATTIGTAIWPIYFALIVSGLANAGLIESTYGYVVSVGNFLVAILAPVLGAVGDYKGMKKKLWSIFMLMGVISTAFMAVFENWVLLTIAFVISRVGFSGSCLFYDSFITDVTTPDRMDNVSAWGYAMGYIGGSTIPFILSIVVLVVMDFTVLAYKLAIAIVPVWWFAFSLPFIKNVNQVYYIESEGKIKLKHIGENILQTLKDIYKDKALFIFVLAYFCYIDGVDTIITMSTNYGSVLGLGTIGMVLALLVTQLVAVPFSIWYGKWGKKYGALKMISIAVGIYSVITIVGFFMGFFIDFNELFGMTQEQALSIGQILFWVLATMVGTVQGGIQALSRSYLGQLVPPERSNEFYGFFDIFGKFAAVIGPLLYSLVFGITGKASFGILALIILFIAGLILLIIGKPYFKAAEHEAIE